MAGPSITLVAMILDLNFPVCSLHQSVVCLDVVLFVCREPEKKNKPPRTLITADGRVMNINEPK